MELKQVRSWRRCLATVLLIVLNGIETTYHSAHRNAPELLIVLNGIETSFPSFMMSTWAAFNRTKWNWNFLKREFLLDATTLLIVLNGIETIPQRNEAQAAGRLLIVLNGIETWMAFSQPRFTCLLIVLNGIETHYGYSSLPLPPTFNRTKWNWNKWVYAYCSC